MGVFVRAVITGFGFSLGKALFDQVSERLGLRRNDEPQPPLDQSVGHDDDGPDRHVFRH